MADQKKWFKVWNSILTDPAFEMLPNEILGVWTRLGCLLCLQGNDGILTAQKDFFLKHLRCDFETIKMLPNMVFEGGQNDNGTITVSLKHWHKYQIDSTSYERVKKFRKRQNDNDTRGEENKKRRDNKRISTKKPVAPPPEVKPQPSKEEITEASETKIEALLKEEADRLYNEKIFPKVYGFVNYLKKENKNPRAILHVLCRLYLSRPSDPWGYGRKIAGIENGNYNERDYQKTT